MMSPARWRFWIDRGGTFTDCLGVDPADGSIRSVKVLSSDRAPLVGIRALLGLADDAPIPPCDLRMGTTVATNALLERRGAPCALLITRGFRDLLEIGTQARPEIFAIDVRKPELLYREVIEIDARLTADGSVLATPDRAALTTELEGLRDRGVESLAVVVLHAYRAPELEASVGEIAREVGFTDVSLSAEVTAELGMVGRGDTSVVDAYLTPLIRRYVAALAAELPGSTLRIMQSSGGLTDAARFRGKNAVLSGPAGGVVASAHVATRAGHPGAIGFDMGGTSTDVSCFDGELERVYETEVAGVRLCAPMMAIHTVAAGGGSICRDNGFRFEVGPESAGADPGPLCYGRPDARDLTITDVNLFLGRVVDDCFPFPLSRAPVEAALGDIADVLEARGEGKSRDEIAAGFFAIACASMAEAIRQVSIAKGRDVRDYALVVFGGAGGQHACPIARLLGIRTLVLDRFAGVLSAYGMGLAELSWHGDRDAGRRALGAELDPAIAAMLGELEAEGRAVLEADGVPADRTRVERRLDLRYRGTDTPITLLAGDTGDLRARFDAAHERLFGYVRDEVIEVVAARVEVLGRDLDLPEIGDSGATGTPRPLREQRLWTDGGHVDAPVYRRDDLPRGTKIAGPALILDDTGTLCLDPGFSLEVVGDARLIVRDDSPDARLGREDTALDPVRLEIFGNLFMSIATQMGEALRRTAVSTNIRERLDFSCAVFDRHGGLVANAPHIPVHLGAMGESVRGVLGEHPDPPPGSVYALNDPFLGGSHLPDITVVTPIHDDAGELLFFTASRGHHADVGGITPGSMPPFSTRLDEEGVVLRALPIVVGGRFDEAAVRAAFASGPHPARSVADNLADLQAQVAANRSGALLLADLLRARGRPAVLAYMQHVQDNAAAEVAARIALLPDGDHAFRDALDDGTPIEVCVHVHGDRMVIDFSGTGAAIDGNLNAPRAVTVAAVIYVLRCLVGAPIPLNSGCLRNVELVIPEGSLLAPPDGSAVAGGNVETSQRIVDVLFGALGVAAASQGTMNNLTFGNESFGYYETICGGVGATATGPGASGIHSHMTNTRITDPEVLESRFPVRLRTFSLRPGSGGTGRHRGGDGVVREIEALEALRVSILSERRTRRPFGLDGGGPGAPGRNHHGDRDLGGKAAFDLAPGETVRIETPGGGGYGRP